MRPTPVTILAILLALVPAALCSQGAFIAVKANVAASTADVGEPADVDAPADHDSDDAPVDDRGLPTFVGLICQDGQTRVVRSAAFDEICFRASLEPVGAAWTHVRGLAAQRVDILTFSSRVRACSLAVVAPPVQPHAPPKAADHPATLS
jgi:hypothetical protein